MSKDIFKDNPNLQVYYKTSDGQAFYQESDARNHAKTLENKIVEKVERTFDEAQPSEKPKEYAMNAKDTIASIREISDVAFLKAFADDDRKSVKEAYDKKLAELTASDADEKGSENDSDNLNNSEDETTD